MRHAHYFVALIGIRATRFSNYGDGVAATCDGTILCAALAKNPADETLRGAWLDWVQEFDQDRWEFVCVQTELETYHRPGGMFEIPGRDSEKRHVKVLFDREDALLAAHRAEWLLGPVCNECAGSGHETMMATPSPLFEPKLHIVGKCRSCLGTGDAGGLTWEMPWGIGGSGSFKLIQPTVAFRRGLPYRVECRRLSDAVMECSQCSGHGVFIDYPEGEQPSCHVCKGSGTVPTPWLRAVTANHPVEEVVPLCRTPTVTSGGGAEWYRDGGRGRVFQTTYHLPNVIFDLLSGERIVTSRRGSYEPAGFCKVYDNAISVLGVAIATFARQHSQGS